MHKTLPRLLALLIALCLPFAGYAATASLSVVGSPVYLPTGGTLTLTATINYPGATPSALGYTINLPTGWALVNTTGTTLPSVLPSVGTTGALEYAYSSFPANAATFNVEVSYPAGLTGTQVIGGSATYRSPLETITLSNLSLTRVEFASITTQPAAKVIALGGSATFSVVATSSTPISYQWKRDGVDVAGATSASLALTNAQLTDGGSYTVALTNAAGTITSTAALLTVIDVRATHAVVGAGYLAGGTVTITNTLTFSGSPASIGWSVPLPAGWAYVSGAGSEPDVKPAAGTTDLLEWAWSTMPVSPATFTYTVSVPAGNTGSKSLSSLVLFRQGALVQSAG